MSYGIIVTVPMPIDTYRAVNAQVTDKLGDRPAPGLLVHIARETGEGFQVIEVWESKQHCDDFQETILGPIIANVSEGNAPRREDVTESFEPQGLFTGTPAQHAS